MGIWDKDIEGRPRRGTAGAVETPALERGRTKDKRNARNIKPRAISMRMRIR